MVIHKHKKITHSDTKKMAGESSDTKDGSKKFVKQEHKKITNSETKR